MLGVIGKELSGVEAYGRDLEYRPLAWLPNILLGATLATVRNDLLAEPPPDLVIGCGRRTVSPALALRRRASATRLVQLMWPETGARRFDLIVLPAHDRRRTGGNILSVLLPPTDLVPSPVDRTGPGTLLAVMGGPRRGHGVDLDGFLDRARRASVGRKLVIVATPRTPEPWRSRVANAAFGEYPALLARAGSVAVSGESTSVMADAARFGLPILIDRPGDPAFGKLAHLHHDLMERGMAGDLARPPDLPPYPPFDSAHIIASEMQKRGILPSFNSHRRVTDCGKPVKQG